MTPAPEREALQYGVVKSPTLSNLTFEMNRMIQDGWTPCGGIAVDGDNTCLYQAITRRTEPAKAAP